jgi:hypothetical protein
MWIFQSELKGSFMERRSDSGERHALGSMAGIGLAFQ